MLTHGGSVSGARIYGTAHVSKRRQRLELVRSRFGDYKTYRHIFLSIPSVF